MTRLVLKLIPLFAVIFLALSLTARALGSTQPPHPALRGFVEGCEDKPQPCWYGIVSGITFWDDAENILEHMGYRPYYIWWGELGRYTYWAAFDQFYLVDLVALPTSDFNKVDELRLYPNCRFEEWLRHTHMGFYVMDNSTIRRHPAIALGGRTVLSTTEVACSRLWDELQAYW